MPPWLIQYSVILLLQHYLAWYDQKLVVACVCKLYIDIAVQLTLLN